MTSSGWLALGAVAACLLGPEIGPQALVLFATAVAVAVAGVRSAGERTGRRWQPILLMALGGLAIGLRMATSAAGGVAPTATLPAGSGPWAGVVQAVSSPRDGQQVATLQLTVADPAGSVGRLVAVAATLPRFPAVAPGDRVRVDGRISAPPAGPYAEYLARVGVDGTLLSRSVSVVGRSEDVGARLEQARRAAGDALAAAVPEPEAGLAAGIVIGLRDRVDRDLAAAFTTVGASHVVAISGWNIAIVAATVAGLTGRMSRRRRSIVLVAAIVGYVLFAGASPSVVRAAAMAGVVLLARETGRAGRAAAALGWAAALLLIADPGLIGDAGFQLSTLATGGILVWASPWTDRIAGLGGGRIPRWLAESLGVSLAAQAATLPVVLATFGRLALISPVVNLAVVPLVAPAMAASLLALIGGALTFAGAPMVVAAIAGLPAWALLTAMCTVIRAAAGLPFANVSFGSPWTFIAGGLSALAILAGPALWRWSDGRRRSSRPQRPEPALAQPLNPAPLSTPRGAARPRHSRIGRVALVALIASTAGIGLAFAHRADGTTRITVLDVGQGDSILVEGGHGGRMLVDGGPNPDRLLVELDRRLPPWDRRIDILVLTHPHEDHVAGMPLLLERYRIGRIYETGMRGPGPGYSAFARELAQRGAPPRALLATGARIALDDIRFHVLWPDPGRVPREPPDGGRSINDVSVVLLGEVAGRRFLLAGDVEDDVDPILASRGLPHVDILKVAHHGSATASTPTFLDLVEPTVAIVSAGAGNPYGHPARSTIDRLQATGARVLRTDTDGSVAVSIDPSGVIGVSTTGAGRTALPGAVLAQLALARIPSAAPAVTGQPGDPDRRVSALVAPSSARYSCGIPSTG